MINNCHKVGNLYKYFDMIDSSGFYSIKPLLSYEKPFMFITGSRSIGKSTSVACFLILDFKENGSKFVYVRRDKDEVQETAPEFFTNAERIISEKCGIQCSVKYKAGSFTISFDGEPDQEFGIAIGLSLQRKYKSKPFDGVGTILYDEFLPESHTSYLGSYTTDPGREPREFNSLYATIDREVGKAYKNGTRAIFLGNTSTVYNPFFVEYGIIDFLYKDEKAKVINPKSAPWVLQRIGQVEATSDYKESILYAISGERERGYNFENNGSDDFAETWIQEPDICSVLCFCRLDKKTYKISRDKDFNFYIQRHVGQASDRVISLDLSSHDGRDFEMIRKWHNDHRLQNILDAFLRGALFFDAGSTRNAWYRYMQLVH